MLSLHPSLTGICKQPTCRGAVMQDSLNPLLTTTHTQTAATQQTGPDSKCRLDTGWTQPFHAHHTQAAPGMPLNGAAMQMFKTLAD